MAKVFKDMIESKIGEEIQSDWVIMLWLVRWVAMMYSRFKLGQDGKTSYERQKGRKCKQEVIPFAEKVLYKKLKDTGARKQVLESQWEEGLWLGHSRTSNEVLIGTCAGIVRAWAIKRKPEEERWDKTLIKNMKGTPAKPDPASSGIEIPTRIFLPKAEDEDAKEWRKPRQEDKPRRTYLKKEDFEVHCFTEGCKGVYRYKQE